MKYLARLSCLCAFAVAAPAYAAMHDANNWYAGLSGDLTWLRHSNMGGGGNAALGYRFGDLRAEGEVGYHGAGGNSGYGGTHYFTYMANAYYDFNTMFPASTNRFVPYIGAGLGDAATHYGNNGNAFTATFHHHDNSFAWQGMAGLNYTAASMPATTWSMGYRYLGTEEHNLHANNLELGVRFNF